MSQTFRDCSICGKSFSVALRVLSLGDETDEKFIDTCSQACDHTAGNEYLASKTDALAKEEFPSKQRVALDKAIWFLNQVLTRHLLDDDFKEQIEDFLNDPSNETI